MRDLSYEELKKTPDHLIENDGLQSYDMRSDELSERKTPLANWVKAKQYEPVIKLRCDIDMEQDSLLKGKMVEEPKLRLHDHLRLPSNGNMSDGGSTRMNSMKSSAMDDGSKGGFTFKMGSTGRQIETGSASRA